MQVLSQTLAAELDSEAAGLCHVWHLDLADGTKIAFTDHDRDLAHQGRLATARSGWTAGARDATAAGDSGLAAIAGVLDLDLLDPQDLATGRYDQGRVVCHLVRWAEPGDTTELWQGTIRRIERRGDGFTAELAGPLAALDQVIGRSFGRLCDAALGDARCGLDPQALAAPACDKRHDTCRSVFGNLINFRGFPAIPGDDFLALYPASGQVHDGGAR